MLHFRGRFGVPEEISIVSGAKNCGRRRFLKITKEMRLASILDFVPERGLYEMY